jgi:hypothetical protein
MRTLRTRQSDLLWHPKMPVAPAIPTVNPPVLFYRVRECPFFDQRSRRCPWGLVRRDTIGMYSGGGWRIVERR